MIRLLLPVFAALAASAADRQVAITIDDLPVAQSGPNACQPERLLPITRGLLNPIRERRIPVTAFVIGQNCGANRTAALRLWRDAGVELANHTYSHRGLNNTPIDEYEQDILRGDAVLREFDPQHPPRFFRWPMLQAGPDKATKERLEAFLARHHYQEGVVTLDNSDWMFAYVYSNALLNGDKELAERTRAAYVPYLESVIAFFEQRSVEVVGREFPQVMLLHANELNSEMLGGVLAMFERRGYKFISLETALADPAYRLENGYAGRGGFSWIHRWSRTKGMPGKGEPGEPEWLLEAYQKMSRR